MSERPTIIDSPEQAMAKALRFAAEAAEEGWHEAVKDICEQTLENLKELVPHWGQDEYPDQGDHFESGFYPTVRAEFPCNPAETKPIFSQPVMKPDYQHGEKDDYFKT